MKEKEDQIEPPPTPNLSNDKEVSTEAHSFVTIPLETHHVPQSSFLQCLKMPSYAIIFKDLCTEGQKSGNSLPQKIRFNKKVGYLRWLNILPKGYEILMKKRWKGLVGHPLNWGRCNIFSFLFFPLYFWVFFLFVILFCF